MMLVYWCMWVCVFWWTDVLPDVLNILMREFISPLVFLWGWVLSLFRCICLWCSWRCSNMYNYALLLFLKIFFWSNDEVCCFLSRWVLMFKWKKVWLFDLRLLYSRNNQISLSVRINFVCPNLLLDISTQQLVVVVLTLCEWRKC